MRKSVELALDPHTNSMAQKVLSNWPIEVNITDVARLIDLIKSNFDIHGEHENQAISTTFEWAKLLGKIFFDKESDYASCMNSLNEVRRLFNWEDHFDEILKRVAMYAVSREHFFEKQFLDEHRPKLLRLMNDALEKLKIMNINQEKKIITGIKPFF